MKTWLIDILDAFCYVQPPSRGSTAGCILPRPSRYPGGALLGVACRYPRDRRVRSTAVVEPSACG